jgi:small neutral amino acid transporter SnatA (MarC family)
LVAGQCLIDALGIGLPAFQIAGGWAIIASASRKRTIQLDRMPSKNGNRSFEVLATG